MTSLWKLQQNTNVITSNSLSPKIHIKVLELLLKTDYVTEIKTVRTVLPCYTSVSPSYSFSEWLLWLICISCSSLVMQRAAEAATKHLICSCFHILTNSSPLYLPVIWKSSLMVELTPSGSFCLGWACGVSQSVLLLVDACWSCERSLHTRGAGGPLRSLATPDVWLRARERKQRVGREKAEERARVDGDGGGVLIDGSLIWGASIDIPPSLPPSGVPARRERESVNSCQVPVDIICCFPGYGGLGEPAAHPKGFRSQVVVSSLPPCSLSLLRWGAEAGMIPARSPVPSFPRKMGLWVPNAAQAAPLQFLQMVFISL